MDVLEKNMIVQTNDTLLNYGPIEETQHTLVGYITSPTPFSFIFLGDDVAILPSQTAEPANAENTSYITNVNQVFTTGSINKFQLQLQGSDFNIHLQLWKPYPVSPVLPN